MAKRIGEQVIVITGASSGIGLATARRAAQRGARVVMAARSAAELERQAAEIRRDGGDALAVPTDVTDYAQVRELARRAIETYGRVDTWFNNAGVSCYATFEEIELEDFRQVLETDFMGEVHGAKAALPLLEETGGALICMGSGLSDRGVPLQSAYCAAKHALEGWVESLRTELQHRGSRVRVTLVKPSSIDTPFFRNAKTYLGVEPAPIPPVYAPELAAEAILRAAAGNERDVVVGGGGKALELAERISPKLVDLGMRRIGFEGQKTSWPKPVDAPSNLWAPLARHGGVHGDSGRTVRQRSRYDQLAANAVPASFAGAAALGLGAWLASRRSASATLPAVLALGAAALAGKGVLAATFEG